ARGMTWMTWRSLATLIARLASTTRWTSSSPISWSGWATATTPVEFWLQVWVPPIETTTDSMRCPAIRSAATAAAWMAEMVFSRLTTTPLRRPSEGASPTPPVSNFSAGCAPPAPAVRITSLQVVPADGAQVVEDPDAEGHDRGNRQVDSQLVAEIGQASGQRHVGDQSAEEHARLERAGDVCLQRAEDRVERRQQGDRRVARVGDRDGDRREQPEDHAEDRKGDRDNDYLHGLGGAGVA